MELSKAGKAAELQFELSALTALKYRILAILECKLLDIRLGVSLLGSSVGSFVPDNISCYDVPANENLKNRIIAEVDKEILRVQTEIEQL